MAVIKAEFDGKVFVPCDKVDLPVGTQVEVVVLNRPPELTPEEQCQWQEILRQIDASPPHLPTLDDAMRYMRKRP